MHRTNFTSAQRESIAVRTLPMILILVSLVAGLLIFTGIAWSTENFALGFAVDLFAMIAIGFSAPTIGLSFLVNRIFISRQAQAAIQADRNSQEGSSYEPSNGLLEKLTMLYQSGLIIRSALLEGCGFFWATLIFIGDCEGISVIAIAVLAVLMLFNFPKVNRIIDWIDSEISNRNDPHRPISR